MSYIHARGMETGGFAFPDLIFLVLWSLKRRKVVKKEWEENKKQKTILYEKRRNIFV